MSAIVSMSAELDTATVLDRLVRAGCTLTGATYGASGVLGPHGDLEKFVHGGLTEDSADLIGALPQGRGVLGHLLSSPKALRMHDVAEHPSSVGFPARHPLMHTFLGVPVRARSAVIGSLYLTNKAGGEDFTARDEQLAVALAASAGIAIDHARTYRRVREHELWLETAAACTSAVTSGQLYADAIAEVVERVRRRTGAARVLLHESPELQPALATDDLVSWAPTMSRMSDGVEIGLAGDVWALLVPLRTGHRWVGGLVACWPADHQQEYPDPDLLSVAGFGEQLALALDVRRAQVDRSRLAVLEESDRIARDLQDMVIQRLFAIGLHLQSAAQDAVPPDVARRLETAIDDLDGTIKDVRTTIFRLSVRHRGARVGLLPRIDAEIGAARRILGFLPRLLTDGINATVPDGIIDDAVAVIREALANVARHAGAHDVVVRIALAADLRIEVQDNGVGMPATADHRSGLANLAHRAAARGGTMTAEGVLKGGSVLRWSVPVA